MRFQAFLILLILAFVKPTFAMETKLYVAQLNAKTVKRVLTPGQPDGEQRLRKTLEEFTRRMGIEFPIVNAKMFEPKVSRWNQPLLVFEIPKEGEDLIVTKMRKRFGVEIQPVEEGLLDAPKLDISRLAGEKDDDVSLEFQKLVRGPLSGVASLFNSHPAFWEQMPEQFTSLIGSALFIYPLFYYLECLDSIYRFSQQDEVLQGSKGSKLKLQEAVREQVIDFMDFVSPLVDGSKNNSKFYSKSLSYADHSGVVAFLAETASAQRTLFDSLMSWAYAEFLQQTEDILNPHVMLILGVENESLREHYVTGISSLFKKLQTEKRPVFESGTSSNSARIAIAMANMMVETTNKLREKEGLPPMSPQERQKEFEESFTGINDEPVKFEGASIELFAPSVLGFLSRPDLPKIVLNLQKETMGLISVRNFYSSISELLALWIPQSSNPLRQSLIEAASAFQNHFYSYRGNGFAHIFKEPFVLSRKAALEKILSSASSGSVCTDSLKGILTSFDTKKD